MCHLCQRPGHIKRDCPKNKVSHKKNGRKCKDKDIIASAVDAVVRSQADNDVIKELSAALQEAVVENEVLKTVALEEAVPQTQEIYKEYWKNRGFEVTDSVGELVCSYNRAYIFSWRMSGVDNTDSIDYEEYLSDPMLLCPLIYKINQVATCQRIEEVLASDLRVPNFPRKVYELTWAFNISWFDILAYFLIFCFICMFVYLNIKRIWLFLPFIMSLLWFLYYHAYQWHRRVFGTVDIRPTKKFVLPPAHAHDPEEVVLTQSVPFVVPIERPVGKSTGDVEYRSTLMEVNYREVLPTNISLRFKKAFKLLPQDIEFCPKDKCFQKNEEMLIDVELLAHITDSSVIDPAVTPDIACKKISNTLCRFSKHGYNRYKKLSHGYTHEDVELNTVRCALAYHKRAHMYYKELPLN